METESPEIARKPPWWRGERARVVAVLLAMALGYFLLGRAFAGDAAKAAARLAKAAAAGEWGSVKDFAAYGTHRFALVNAGIVVLLAATIRRWHRGWRAETPAANMSAPAVTARWFWVLLAACVVLAGALRLPLAKGGFWHDEGLQMKRVSGNYQRDKPGPDGVPGFREASWLETWFHFRKPTNHTALGVPARASLESWRRLTGAKREEFCEFAVRLPSFLTALASVGLAGLIGRRWAGPAAGIAAATFLAMHPWHIHWSIDARAYGIGIFSVLLAFWGLTAALRTGRWRWWCVFGFAQFYLLWASIMHVWVAAALFAVAAWMVWRQRADRPVWPQWARLGAVNVVAATLFLQVMGPNLMQFAEASKLRDPAAEEFMKLDAATGMDTASHLLLGLPHDVPFWPGDEPIATYVKLFAGAPLAGWAMLAVAALLILFGMAWCRKSHPAGALMLAALLAAGGLHLVMTKALDWYYYPRFSTYLLPLAALGWGVAWSGLGKLAGGRWRPAGWLAIPLGLVVFLSTAKPQLENLVRHTHEPFPEMRAMFTGLRAAAPRGAALTACYGLAGDIMQEIYDPRCLYIRSRDQVDALMREASTQGKPLYIAYGLQSFNRATVPDGFNRLDDPRLFTLRHRFVSNDPRHTFFLLEYTGRSPD